MHSLYIHAPAKVNLFLEVTGKRPDGYHNLATLFAKISLCDRLHLEVEPAGQEDLQLHITGPLAAGLQADENNLVLRAVRAFEAQFGCCLRAHMELEKHIPMGAGLGGGSSDAGTVLRALCQLFDKNPLELLPRAAKLGADVPLFLYPDTFLKGEGIGEQLQPVAAPGPLPWAVLVYPDTAVPTGGVFGRLSLPGPQECLTSLANLDKLINCLETGRPLPQWQHLLFNRLEEAVLPYVACVQDVKNDFLALGASPLMSGSGSTVFALTPDPDRAEDLAGKMQQTGRKVFIIRFGGKTHEDYGNPGAPHGGGPSEGVCKRDI